MYLNILDLHYFLLELFFNGDIFILFIGILFRFLIIFIVVILVVFCRFIVVRDMLVLVNFFVRVFIVGY